MSRYIDADALDRAFSKLRFNNDGELEHYGDRPNWYLWGSEVENLIADAPSIDIVRCGECKYKRLYDDGETKYYYCALEDRPNRQWSVDDTDFCSWGEREGE